MILLGCGLNIVIIYIAPLPVGSRSVGINYRVLSLFKMLAGMLVFGRIAAACIAAGHALSDSYPAIAGF